MSENKFIAQLKGNAAPGSVLEVQDKGSKTSFANMPSGTSDAIVTYSDKRNNATAVLKGAMNWKVNGSTLSVANPAGDGSDYTGQTAVAGISDQQGNNLWINASYTVPADGLFLTKNTKWVLKLCGDNLIVNGGDTAEFTVLITAGNSTNITKKFYVGEQANQFCKELVIDFAESNTSTVKLEPGDTITLKLLSDIPNASARIYQGMTTLTLLQRAVDAENIISNEGSYEDVCEEINKKVNTDGSSIMSGPLKFRAGSFVGAIAGGLGDGISFYKLKSDNTIDSEVASLTKTNGFTPGTTNTMNIGSSALKWKDLYVARVITSVLNNGADISVPTTAGTMALTSDIKNSTVSVQLDGSAVDSFTLNQSSNKTINIPAANKDLSNLTSTGANIGNWSSNVTNCITEIPQDIKLELNGGTLTLKAGSKVYVPNGSGVFNTVTTTQDISVTISGAAGQYYIYKTPGNNINYQALATIVSGTTDSLSGTPWHVWYDTTNNVINRYTADGTTPNPGQSFPIAIVTVSGGAITSIDQVFNGFGYIGLTVFILPNVKVLTSDGFNADGTLKNKISTSATVNIKTLSSTCALCVNTSLGIADRTSYYVVKNKKEMSNINASGVYYVTEENLGYSWSGGSSTMYKNFAYIGSCQITSGKITYFSINKPFHAVDYNDYQKTVSQVDTNIANIALKQDEATAVNYENIANCITEIPQDIKLELNNGKLTLKAGSKVYTPNGAGVFNTITINANKTFTHTTNGTWIIIADGAGNMARCIYPADSGSTQPGSLSTGLLWYDTTNNYCKRWDGSGWKNCSFPIAIVTVSGGQITSINQVFNGFGYIGSTVFALPGVKGLIPNGRNTDGTLKNANLTTGSVLTVTVGTGTSTDTLRITNSALQRGSINYNSEFNYNYLNTFSSANIRSVAVIGSVSYVSGKITSLKTKTPFHSVDYSDSEYIANCAMPSGRYVDLTLGEAPSNYTAPADGYVTFTKVSANANEVVVLSNITAGGIGNTAFSIEGKQWLRASIPVSKGDVFVAEYSAKGATKAFRFVYANGAK